MPRRSAFTSPFYLAFLVALSCLVLALPRPARADGDAGTPDVKGNKWQEGEACVGSNSAPECKDVTGTCETAKAPGCTHDACTAAKNLARQALRNRIPSACHKYIKSGKPCRSGPGCK